MSRIFRFALPAVAVCGLVSQSRPALLAAQGAAAQLMPVNGYQALRWRNVGAARGGRMTAAAGVRQQPHTFDIGASGGVCGRQWKTNDAGMTWHPVGDCRFTTGLANM